jgi:DNA-binding FadR family transcriptional regulator
MPAPWTCAIIGCSPVSHTTASWRIFYNFVIELFTKTINPIHVGVAEVHQRLHQAIMDRDADKAVEAVREHTAIWISGYQAAHNVG